MAAPAQSVQVRRALPDGEVTAVKGVVPLDPGSRLRAHLLVSLLQLLPHTVRVRPLVAGSPAPILDEGSFFLADVQEGQVITVEGVDIPRHDGAVDRLPVRIVDRLQDFDQPAQPLNLPIDWTTYHVSDVLTMLRDTVADSPEGILYHRVEGAWFAQSNEVALGAWASSLIGCELAFVREPARAQVEQYDVDRISNRVIRMYARWLKPRDQNQVDHIWRVPAAQLALMLLLVVPFLFKGRDGFDGWLFWLLFVILVFAFGLAQKTFFWDLVEKVWGKSLGRPR